mmetsp:Transcript_63479/g.127475  ORF Transcript_63479/g.127475 Transcript_63479/m.127475 type:complete len:311 (+) Transcript_63479:340-1272(+)
MLLGAFKDHFVVDLKQQPVPEALEHRAVVDLHHGEHDNIRRSTLDRRVDGGALSVAPEPRPRRSDVVELAVPPTQSPREAGAARLLDHVLLPRLHFGAVGVPRLEQPFRLLHRHAPVFAQAVRGLAVRDGEVQRLGFAPLRAVHVLDEGRGRGAFGVVPLEQHFAVLHRFPHVLEHAHRGAAVEAAPVLEGLEHRLALGHVREQPELQLPVVGHDELVAFLAAKGIANLVLVLFQCGLVLQVGHAAGEAARFRVEVEAAVHAALLVHQVLQGLDERPEHGVDGAHAAQSVQRHARFQTLWAPAEKLVRGP